LKRGVERRAGGLNVSGSQQEEARKHQQKIQQQLDEALADSFPASDPVSIVTSNEEEDWGEPSPTKETSGVAPKD
jgi:hypothetical protein